MRQFYLIIVIMPNIMRSYYVQYVVIFEKKWNAFRILYSLILI